MLPFPGTHTEGEPPATDMEQKLQESSNPRGAPPTANRRAQLWGAQYRTIIKIRQLFQLPLPCRNSMKNALGYLLKFSSFRITPLRLAFAIARNLSSMKGRAGCSQMESTCLCNMKRQNNGKKLLHVMTVEFPAQLPPNFPYCLSHSHSHHNSLKNK